MLQLGARITGIFRIVLRRGEDPRRRRFVCATLVVATALTSVLTQADAVSVQAATTARRAQMAPVVQGNQVLAIVGGGGANLVATPGGELVTALPAGTNLTALGRSADGAWVAVRIGDDVTGWVPAADILMFGGGQLPVLAGGERIPSSVEEDVPVTLPTPTATPEPSPTPLPTPTPLATATATPAPIALGSTSTASMDSGVASAAASQVAVVRSGGADLVAAPGGESVRRLATGTALTVSGRTEDGAWLAAITPQGVRGWVPAANVIAFNVSQLPVVAASAVDSASEEAGTGVNLPGSTAPSQTVEEQPGQEASPARLPSITATVAITDSRLNVRAGPGTAYQIVTKALPGERFSATGRNADSSWIRIASEPLGVGEGWVASEYVSLSAPSATLPVVDAGAVIPAGLSPAPASRPALPAAPVARPVSSTGLTGNLVVQTNLGGEIYVVDLATGQSRYLVSGIDPAISPDGTTVAFTRDGGDHGLYLIDIDGTDERRIFSGGEKLRAATWSPDGRYVLFNRLAGEYECRDVGFGICLPDNPFLSDFDLTTRPEYGLSRVNAEGGDFRDLATLTSAKAPSWSEGGIVYQSNTGLEITKDEPVATTSLLLNAPYYQDPDWQPGSDRIIFQSREGSHWEIFSVAQDGSGLFALTKPVTTLVDELPSNVSPAWSPDGQQIVYLSNRDERNDAGEWRLWVMNADGSEQRPLDIDLSLEYNYAAEQVVDWGMSPTR